MYKTSKYNYFVNYQDKVLWFNGISGAMFAMNQKKSEILELLLNNLASFKMMRPKLFDKLKESQMITYKKLNELDKIRYLNRKSIYNDKHAKITINPTRNCNFNCWYCVQPHEESIMSKEVINRIKSHISNLVAKKEINSLEIDWFGGEPLLGFNEVIYPLTKYCKKLFAENNLKLEQHITTNAFLIDGAMIKKMQEINLNSFQITLDGDEKRHNKIRNNKGEPSFKTIMHNINLICKGINNPSITIRINYDKKTLNGNIKDIFDGIPKEYRKYIKINFQKVWQLKNKGINEKGSLISEDVKVIELQDYANQLGFKPRLISNALTINKWHTCYVDKPNFKHFDFDGKVYKCTARDYSDKHQFGELSEGGIILWDKDKMSKMYGKSTFENEMCLQCKHLPLCMGPCSQKIFETPIQNLHEVCTFKNSDIKMEVETFVIDLYKNRGKTDNVAPTIPIKVLKV